MKLCPKCNLNWIEEEKDFCSICNNQKTITVNNGIGGGRKSLTAYFQEEFTFTNQRVSYRGKEGFQAYNMQGENVGIVFMCDDKRTPAYEHCELCIYEDYHTRYGEWHRITSHGGRIKWSKLCEILQQKTNHKIFID